MASYRLPGRYYLRITLEEHGTNESIREGAKAIALSDLRMRLIVGEFMR